MAKLWEIYDRASPEVKGVINQRVRDIANVLVFEQEISGFTSNEVMNRLYDTDINSRTVVSETPYMVQGSLERELVCVA